jgi:RNA polymerase sigma-70 factor (ECF subfamily)
MPAGVRKPAIDWAREFTAHGRWLRLTVLARVGERQAVEEVMQEVALAAVAGQASLTDVARLPAWLHRIAVRQCLLYRRKHGRSRRLLDQFQARATADGEGGGVSDPLDWLLREERVRLVREALTRLASRDAELVLLKYAENWTARELATHLGVGIAAVEARLHRARERLRAELASRVASDSPSEVSTR